MSDLVEERNALYQRQPGRILCRERSLEWSNNSTGNVEVRISAFAIEKIQKSADDKKKAVVAVTMRQADEEAEHLLYKFTLENHEDKGVVTDHVHQLKIAVEKGSLKPVKKVAAQKTQTLAHAGLPNDGAGAGSAGPGAKSSARPQTRIISKTAARQEALNENVILKHFHSQLASTATTRQPHPHPPLSLFLTHILPLPPRPSLCPTIHLAGI